MSIETSGPNQNSYITIAEANAILLTVHASFMEVGTQLDPLKDEAYLIEAGRDLAQLFAWVGQPTSTEQNMAWPRKGVPKPGYVTQGEPQWSVPGTDLDFLAYKVNWLSGSSSAPMLDENVVPLEIREAQALIAVLRKEGLNLVSDNQGDSQGLQLPGGLKVAYVNAVRESADIHKRTAQFGVFVGQSIVGA
jgi:hypothetical protein